MKVHINLSIDVETAEIVKEARARGLKISHILSGVMKSLAENDYKYPVTYAPESAI